VSSLADDERLDAAQDALELAAFRIGQQLGLVPMDVCSAMAWALARTAARHTLPQARLEMTEQLPDIVKGALEQAFREIDQGATDSALASMDPLGSA